MEMKRTVIIGAIFMVSGMLLAAGPQFIFKVCDSGCICCGDIPTCHWSAQAEIGVGAVILAIGICLLVFNDMKVQFGLNIGILFNSIIAFFIPFSLIGLCVDKTMACHRTAFPAITVICIVLPESV